MLTRSAIALLAVLQSSPASPADPAVTPASDKAQEGAGAASTLPPDGTAPKAAEPASSDPAQASGAAAATPSAPHIGATRDFLIAWGHERWEKARAVAADSVTVQVSGKSYAVDVKGGASTIRFLLPFRGLSAVREGGKLAGVRVSEAAVQTESGEKRGQAVVHTEEQDGQARVTSVEIL